MSGSIVTFDDAIPFTPIAPIIAEINPIQSGTGDPSPDNVRPISGWTGCEFFHRNKNLFDSEKWGQLSNYPHAGSYGYYYTDYIRLSPNTAYIASAQVLGADSSVVADYGIKIPTGNNPQNPATDAGSANTWIVNSGTVQNKTFTTGPSGYIALMARNPNAANLAALMAKQIQIELGSTATTFEAYHGNSIPINWQSEAGTIYGGTVTLNEDGSADVASEYGVFTADGSSDEKWIYVASHGGCFIWQNTGAKAGYYYNDPLSICNNLKKVKLTDLEFGALIGTAATNNELWVLHVGDTLGIDNVSQFREWLAVNPVSFTAKLITSLSYHIPNVGQLKTFLGTNNIWADTGNVTATYIANAARFSFNSPLHRYNFVNLKLFGNTYIEHGKG